MTKEEILEAESLIGEIKDNLALIAAAGEVEKMISVILEKGPAMINRFQQLVGYRPRIFETVSESEAVEMGLAVLMAVAELAKLRPENKSKLNAPVMMLRLCSTLDKAARDVRELKSARPDA